MLITSVLPAGRYLSPTFTFIWTSIKIEETCSLVNGCFQLLNMCMFHTKLYPSFTSRCNESSTIPTFFEVLGFFLRSKNTQISKTCCKYFMATNVVYNDVNRRSSKVLKNNFRSYSIYQHGSCLQSNFELCRFCTFMYMASELFNFIVLRLVDSCSFQ